MSIAVPAHAGRMEGNIRECPQSGQELAQIRFDQFNSGLFGVQGSRAERRRVRPADIGEHAEIRQVFGSQESASCSGRQSPCGGLVSDFFFFFLWLILT